MSAISTISAPVALDDRLREAQSHLDAGRVDAARAIHAELEARHREETGVLRLGARIALDGGDVAGAVACLERAARARPDDGGLLRDYGYLLLRAGRPEDAVAPLERAVAAIPGDALAWVRLGRARRRAGRAAEALEACRRAVTLDPDSGEAWIGLGLAHRALDALDAAEEAYRAGVARRPADPIAHYNLGNVLHDLGRFAEAASSLGRAIALDPDYDEALANYALVLRQLGRAAESCAVLDRVVARRPDHGVSRFNRAIALFDLGRFADAFADYEFRWGSADATAVWRGFPQPLWGGEQLAGRRLLVWQEQGVGDEIMFAGLLPALAAAGAHLVVECERRLVPLFARSFPAAEVVARANRPDARLEAGDIDFQVPAGSLARRLGWGQRRPAPLAPYLRADAARAGERRAAYRGGDDRPLVGIAWQSGNKRSGHLRTLPLDAWGAALRRPEWRFVDLQYGDHAGAVANARAAFGADIVVDGTVDQMADLDAFAGQVAALDAVLTIDNSAAHMAGALGVPTQLMLPPGADWRWQFDAATTPWYGALRLHRRAHGDADWAATLAAASEAVAATLAARDLSGAP